MRKNTPITGFPFHLVNRNNGLDINAGAVVGHYVIDGGTQATFSDTPVPKGNGQWTINIQAAERLAASGLLAAKKRVYMLASPSSRRKEGSKMDNKCTGE